MNDIGKNLQRRLQLDCEHQLADHRCTDQHAALTVGDQLKRTTVKVMDSRARSLPDQR